MNEKIKQLAQQSNLLLDDLPDNILLPLEKFVELLVDDVCDDMMSLEPMYPANIVALKIRQKYGVGSKVNLGSLDQYDDPAWQGKNWKNVDL
jgi:hypothetical protein